MHRSVSDVSRSEKPVVPLTQARAQNFRCKRVNSCEHIQLPWVRVPSMTSRTKTFLAMFAVVLVCYLVFSSLLWPVQVLGDSMQPTFDDGTRHYVNKLAYWSEKPKRGDVVTLRVRAGEMFIKRIVGLPGETVAFKDGKLVINGQPMPEYYTDRAVPWEFEPVKIREDCYFVIGDNRATSVLGMIPAERIVGKVIF
jgi:signal peptidase I